MYQRILLAVDGSHCAELAMEQAIGLAKAGGGAVQAIFIADDIDMLYDARYYDPGQMRRELEAWGEKVLAATARRCEAAGVPCTTRLVTRPAAPGHFAESIVAEAEACGADLLVLGTHGRRGLSRALMGSVAEGVVRKSRLPVLLVRSDSRQPAAA
ncbi:universal stress protein UspA [Cupriavidus sp. USMAA2-4]|uniref:universal stress protein n=1 Tax=Cupriavidus sp. USMAA2-4 TaxID=876364 RepID=UPI0008A6896F|nr:universal stress protein [Cupriavidus sp. USMAA2-4]AOY95031.1 universal stress protein UspA [Cupriavidus sp. USMAA2-4]